MCTPADEAFLKQCIATLQTKPRSECTERAPGEFFLEAGVRFTRKLSLREVMALCIVARDCHSANYEIMFAKVGEIRGGTTLFVTLKHK